MASEHTATAMNGDSSASGEQRTPLQWAQAANERIKGKSAIYDFLLQDITFVSAEAGQITARLPVQQQHVNSRGSLHGAVSATIVDWAGGMAIATKGREETGVSTDIHVSYLSTAAVGEVLEIKATANRVGATLAFTEVDIRKVGRGLWVARGSHTKMVKKS